jgi:hypothetical protein
MASPHDQKLVCLEKEVFPTFTKPNIWVVNIE